MKLIRTALSRGVMINRVIMSRLMMGMETRTKQSLCRNILRASLHRRLPSHRITIGVSFSPSIAPLLLSSTLLSYITPLLLSSTSFVLSFSFTFCLPVCASVCCCLVAAHF